MRNRKICVFGCPSLGAYVHRFPHPTRHPKLFSTWLSIVGQHITELLDINPMKIYSNKRVCDYHFRPEDKVTGHRLIHLAVPHIHFEAMTKTVLLCIEIEHNYCVPRHEPATLSQTVVEEDHIKKPSTSKDMSSKSLHLPQHQQGREISRIHAVPVRKLMHKLSQDVAVNSTEDELKSPAAPDVDPLFQDTTRFNTSSKEEKDILLDSTDNDPMSPAGPDVDPLSQGEPGSTESLEEEKQCKVYKGGVCMCCMATDHLEELFTEQQGVDAVHKNHAKMVQACFGVQVSETDGHDSICRSCVSKLHEAAEFKKQILKTMSILMSVKVEQLLPDLHDINALGLNEEFEDDANWKVETIDEELLNDDGETVKSCGDKADDEEMEPYCDYIDDDLWSSEEADTKEEMKSKPPLGRSRKYLKPNMPYINDLQDTVCKECGQEFPNNLTLKKHYNSHLPNFGCAQCGKGFMKAQDLQNHVRTQTRGPFVCHVCGQEFKAFCTLESHKRLKHSPLYQCSQCELRFSSKYVQLQHLKQAHGICDMKYQCSQCHMRFRLSEEISKHEATHQKIPYACPLCDYSSTLPLVRAHLTTKHNIVEKKFKCDICSKKFSKRWTLIEHVNRHLNIRKYTCPRCDKGFVQKRVLKYHIEAHLRRGEYVDQTA